MMSKKEELELAKMVIEAISKPMSKIPGVISSSVKKKTEYTLMRKQNYKKGNKQ